MVDSGGGSGRPWSGGGRDELTTAVRRLIAATVASVAPEHELRAATAELEQVASRLEAHVPEATDVPRPRFSDHGATATMADAMPFDVIIGVCNPLAPPIELRLDPPRAIGTVTFDVQYEGAPGCVHGAVIIGAFDVVLTGANVVAGAAGPTVELTAKYLRPTLIGHESVFEAEVIAVEGRRVRSRGTLTQNGVVTVESEGEFVALDRSSLDAMHKMARRAPSRAAPPNGADGKD